MFSQIMTGIVGVAVGAGLVIYARQLVQWFGTNGTFERYLGNGGTYTGLRILGILTILISLAYATGSLPGMISGAIKGVGLGG